MPETTFTPRQVQRLRNGATRAREIPEACIVRYEKTGVEWLKSDVDPMRLLAVFPSLCLKPGLILRAYQYYSSGNGNGIIWAMPESDPFPEPDQCPKVEDAFLEPPKPPGALSNLMSAINGNGSPRSYLSASIFAREAAEFGALWHGRGWSDVGILYGNPLDGHPDKPEWEWVTDPPSEWSPTVEICEETAVVRFHTYTDVGQSRILCHQDRYTLGDYRFEYHRTEIALGPGGIVY